MGSAYTTLAADAIARYQRLRGRRVTFVTGTDEHGEKIAEAAAKKGQAPQEHCDAVVASFKALWDEVGSCSVVVSTSMSLACRCAIAWHAPCHVAPRPQANTISFEEHTGVK